MDYFEEESVDPAQLGYSLSEFLTITYQGGQVGLAGFAFIFILLNPSWYRRKQVYFSLIASFFLLFISATLGVSRYYFSGDQVRCQVLAYIDMASYGLHMTIVVMMVIWRLVVAMERRLVFALLAIYGAFGLGLNIAIGITAKPYIEDRLIDSCHTGRNKHIISAEDGIRLFAEVLAFTIFIGQIMLASDIAQEAKATLSARTRKLYDVIISKGIFRIFGIVFLDLLLIVLSNLPPTALPPNVSKVVRLAANMFRLSLFLADYLDQRFISYAVTGSDGSSYWTNGSPSPGKISNLPSPGPMSARIIV